MSRKESSLSCLGMERSHLDAAELMTFPVISLRTGVMIEAMAGVGPENPILLPHKLQTLTHKWHEHRALINGVTHLSDIWCPFLCYSPSLDDHKFNALSLCAPLSSPYKRWVGHVHIYIHIWIKNRCSGFAPSRSRSSCSSAWGL